MGVELPVHKQVFENVSQKAEWLLDDALCHRSSLLYIIDCKYALSSRDRLYFPIIWTRKRTPGVQSCVTLQGHFYKEPNPWNLEAQRVANHIFMHNGFAILGDYVAEHCRRLRYRMIEKDIESQNSSTRDGPLGNDIPMRSAKHRVSQSYRSTNAW